ncbi:ABC transporter ATP-binding protein [Sphingomonas oleivorans]|uniref:ABC transporter ATP-binding protein n=1 Tax=Sphingomonas oleivorans TaxID=1735121 RepID=A0A2T5G264_9SPHN|nr:ABC transporter ATP-binding protein [Sphingomonas oleivorans]PTQ13228.1 ABC transporter ATP-binding protein [Sphingomonas oleivorans]
MSELIIENLAKHFGDVRAIDGISLTVADGEFLTLLGPSGCGKSTTLFAIAGLDTPTGGVIRVGNQTFFDGDRGILVPPEKRNCGLVFQSYALWPHMTVMDNLAFPLRIRKVGAAERQRRIMSALELVEMDRYAKRYPHELSGGQQQRVALARTLVFEPSLLLLDEPLSNLDAKLRIRARNWLKELQKRLNITTIYVTHDQIEALAMSDRIAVMNKGSVVQLASPQEVYTRPSGAFVADFIGSSNFLRGRMKHRNSDGGAEVILEGGLQIRTIWAPEVQEGSDVLVAVRPEHIRLAAARPAANDTNLLTGRITGRSYLGARYQYALEAGGTSIAAETEDSLDRPEVYATFEPEHAVVVLP